MPLALGSRFRSLQFSLIPIPYDSGNTRSVEIPPAWLTKSISIRLTGSLNVTAALTLNGETPLPLMQKIELVGDGSTVIWSISGRDAYRYMHILTGKAGELVPPPTAIGGAQAFSAQLYIDAAARRFASPVDSYLDIREFQKTELRITWAAVGSLFSAGTATMNAGCQADIQCLQTTEGLGSVSLRKLLQFDERSIVATTPNFEMVIPRVGLLAGILVRTDSSLVPVDTIINTVSLISDTTFRHLDRINWRHIQSRNIVDYDMDGGAGGGDGHITGYGYIDLTEDGMLSSAINVQAINELKLSFDLNLVGGTPILRASYMFFEALQKTAAAAT